MLYGVEIKEKVANKGLIDLGDYIANLVILDIHVEYYPEILLLNIYIYIYIYIYRNIPTQSHSGIYMKIFVEVLFVVVEV